MSWARLQRPRSLVHDIHALRGIDLQIREGERLGVIGPNGSGKSTLLRAISGVYPLIDGSITCSGNIRGLFEIGLGFEIEATGRENIFYRALLMGERPAAIRARVEEIVAFADLGEFIEYPVKTYSAGMQVRLAFAISTAFPSDILLLDEVLGAGDAAFMKKANERIIGVIHSANVVVLVSHDLGAVVKLCTRVVRLEQGRVVDEGDPQQVVAAYEKNAAR